MQIHDINPILVMKENSIEIYGLNKLNYFNDKVFSLLIHNELYLLTGTNLELKTINQEKGTLIIEGNLFQIQCGLKKGSAKQNKDSSIFKKIFK